VSAVKHAEQAPLFRDALVEMGVESWRFARLFVRVLQNVELAEQQRYRGQLAFHSAAVEKCLSAAGLRLVNLEGEKFDPGMAVTVANPTDFGPNETLFVEQMLEPVILDNDGLVRTGKVILGRGHQCASTSA
jgi:hypothetical protein